MAVPPLRSLKEVIDLTGDDDDDVAPPLKLPLPSDTLSNGLKGTHVGGHAHAQPQPPQPPSPSNFEYEPPAKRQKLSAAPPGQVRPSGTRKIYKKIKRSSFRPYARAAAESITDERVDKLKLRAEVQTALFIKFSDRLRQDGKGNPKHLREEVDAHARALAKNFASLPGFRQLPSTAAPTPIAASAQDEPARVPTAQHTSSYNSFAPASGRPSFTTASAQPQALTPPLVAPNQAARLQATKATIAQPPQPAPLRTRAPVPVSRQSGRVHTPPASPRRTRTAVAAPTSPANFRSRAKVAAWKSEGNKARKEETKKPSSYLALDYRPYLDARSKDAILKSNGRFQKLKPGHLEGPEIFHVDFTLDEAREVQAAVRRALNRQEGDKKDPCRDIARLLRKVKGPDPVARLARQISIERRITDDIYNFFQDVLQKKPLAKGPEILSIEKDVLDKRGEDLRDSRLSSLLLAREITGNHGFSMRQMENFRNEFQKVLEDGLELRAEFTNCAGDLSTISWVSDTAYIAGTTVHMDSHNQQYNKPGNLVLGTASFGGDYSGAVALEAYADHRIPRPLVEKGENSTDEMRESQDPWLYTSVVSSDYDPIHDLAYTSGFDRTVKVWKVDRSKPTASMVCLGTWEHEGVVNFAQASTLESSDAFVATASDVPVDAIRIYRVNPEDIANSTYTSLSASRIRDLDGTPLVTDKWAYFPSTMKWGIEASVKHLLLVGFSPRSFRDDDSDIPQERLNTGELCLWDCLTGKPVRITSANSQNVFEVQWHPTQPVFIMASSPTGNNIDIGVRTQVRVFTLKYIKDHGLVCSELKTLDCPAIDINELTMMPNSSNFSYVTAGCTDGKTYVWDSGLSDKPLHALAHGPPLEGVTVGDDEDDTGVKFTAWGKSPDRFYTGSSDGVVKVWSIRGRKAEGRVILEAPAQISYGAFSPDYTKLVIGDASGRVFILSVDENEDEEVKDKNKYKNNNGHNKARPAPFVSLPGNRGTRRRPTPIKPHLEPPPPPGVLDSRQLGISLGRAYVGARHLRDTRDPTVGMVQDINYAETGLFRREAHADYDPGKPVMAHYERHRQHNVKMFAYVPVRTKRLKKIPFLTDEEDEKMKKGNNKGADRAQQQQQRRRLGADAVRAQHVENCRLDLEMERLSLVPEVRDILAREGVGPEQLRRGVFDDDDFEYVDDADEVCRKGVVDRRREDDDELGY